MLSTHRKKGVTHKVVGGRLAAHMYHFLRLVAASSSSLRFLRMSAMTAAVAASEVKSLRAKRNNKMTKS